MAKAIKNFFVICLSVVLLGSLFVFSGCGKNYTYQDIQQCYNDLIQTYDGKLFATDTNGRKIISFNYSSNLKTQIIAGTEQNQMRKLSNNISDGQAIFEPILCAGFESIDYYIRLDNPNSKNVPQKTLNEIYKKLNTLKNCMQDLNASKTRLEEIVDGGTNIFNWIENYRNLFYDTICASNDFALSYIYAYKDYINEIDQVDGRMSPQKIQLQYVQKLAESADVYTKIVLSQVKNTPINTGQNFCNKMLENYRQGKAVFEDQRFQFSLSLSKIGEEQLVIDISEELFDFDVIYRQNHETISKILDKFSIKTLMTDNSAKPLSFEQQLCKNKIQSFQEQDTMIALNYLKSLTTSLSSWSAKSEEIYG